MDFSSHEVIFLLAQFTVVVIAVFLSNYLAQKGKNAATKEDIQLITSKIESVKHEYARQLESVRAVLNNEIHIHQTRYAKEFDILAEFSESLVVLRDATLALRPSIDFPDPDETKEERKKNRLSVYNAAGRELYKLHQKWRPFYPEELYNKIAEIDRVAWKEVVQYRHGDDSEDWKRYWNEAEANASTLVKLTEEAQSLIRKRVKEWESLDFTKTSVAS